MKTPPSPRVKCAHARAAGQPPPTPGPAARSLQRERGRFCCTRPLNEVGLAGRSPSVARSAEKAQYFLYTKSLYLEKVVIWMKSRVWKKRGGMSMFATKKKTKKKKKKRKNTGRTRRT